MGKKNRTEVGKTGVRAQAAKIDHLSNFKKTGPCHRAAF
jgi:hypothetical protein